MSKQKKDQINSGIHSVLSHPLLYLAFQRLVGIDAAFKKYIKDVIKPATNSRILDIGCGEGYILSFLPKGVKYVGYDMSASYINYAQKKYGARGTFNNQRVSDMAMRDIEPFDIVLATGLLHHLNDAEGQDLFEVGSNCLKSGGLMFTYDNAYCKGQSPIASFISSRDRGQHVRFPEQYHKIALSAFKNIDVIIKHDMIRIPQTVCILKCYKS